VYILKSILVVLGVMLYLGLGVFVTYLGYQGIAYNYGDGWAITALVLLFLFKGGIFIIPMIVGVCLGVEAVLGWHWSSGLLLIFPHLIFLVPAFGMAAFEKIKNEYFPSKVVMVDGSLIKDPIDADSIDTTMQGKK